MSVSDFLKEAILELKDIDEASLVPELTIEELDLDSLDYVEIQVLLKKKYMMKIDPELFVTGKILTLGDLISYIENNIPATV